MRNIKVATCERSGEGGGGTAGLDDIGKSGFSEVADIDDGEVGDPLSNAVAAFQHKPPM